MNKIFYISQQKYIKVGVQQLVDNIKILLYKEDDTVFDRLDFNDDSICQEPLLFAYFNNQGVNKTNIDFILYGYTKPSLRPNKIQVESDEIGRIYLPNFGWLETGKQNQFYDLVTNNVTDLQLWCQGENVTYRFEPLEYIPNTQIELLKYPIPLLNQCYYDVEQNLISVEIEAITNKHRINLSKAWNLIKENAPEHYNLIKSVATKCVIFNVSTYLRNSFATLSAQGIGFFNAYQENYNEVFFVDDIAHQTGHVIFNALIYEVNKFILVDPHFILQTLQLGNNTTETRSIHILFHALYTYYTTFVCLDACLEAEAFKGLNRHEALGRMNFYLGKCYQDLILINEPRNGFKGAEYLFTPDGLKMYEGINETFKEMVKKWGPIVKEFDMSNQPYNFTYSKFLELNPFYEEV